jgi:hypothetical protein
MYSKQMCWRCGLFGRREGSLPLWKRRDLRVRV